MPPWMSEVRLSPTMTELSLEKDGTLEKQLSKYRMSGLLKPISSEIKIFSKYFCRFALASRPFYTAAVPYVTRYSRYVHCSVWISSSAPSIG